MMVEIPLAGALGWCAVRLYKNRETLRPGALDRFIAAALVCSPLLMPFYFDYDLLLLAVPAALVAADLIREASPDKRVLRTFCGLYIVSFAAIPISGATNIQPTTIVLTLLAGQLVMRAMDVRMRETAKPVSSQTGDQVRAMAA
jgi:hypothetical protein